MSGSSIRSRQKIVASAPTGRQSSRRSRGAGFRERYDAAQIARASFASSEGWKTAGPNEIQRRAPLIAGPITSTAASNAREASTSTGESRRNRR